jgi:hypothetical protein
MGSFYCPSCGQGTTSVVMPKFCSHCGESFLKTSKSTPTSTKPVFKKRILDDSMEEDENQSEDVDINHVPSVKSLDIEIARDSVRQGIKLGDLRLEDPVAIPRPKETSNKSIAEQIKEDTQFKGPIEID